MADGLLFALTLLAAVGCGLIGGVFFAFSSFVMGALARLPPAQGIAAMQSINVVVLNPWFMAPFLGTAAVSAVLITTSLFALDETGAIFRLAGGGLYLVGTLLVTGLFNVPRNDALDKVKPDSDEGVTLWARYVPEWSAWNTVRAAAAIAAAAAFTIALGRE